MKITAISGSPKSEGSVSELIIKQVEQILGEEIQIYHAARTVQSETSPDILNIILNADILLIVFPLYVDSLPAPLIELLTRIEQIARKGDKKPRVYSIINCGLHESEHNILALDMIKYFTERAGLSWGYGLGIGHGGMLASMGENWSKGPAGGVYAAIRDMVGSMREGKGGDNVYVAPKFPRFLYIAAANLGWHMQARKNGVLKQLKAQPYKK